MGLVDGIVSWLREQAMLAGRTGAVVGLSGGLDSSVVGVLCKKAFGDEVLGLILPCQSSDRDIEHSEDIANKFEIETVTVDLDPVLGALLDVLPEGTGISVANLKPRLRMITLYYFANEKDYLVVGTGNRSELEMGYFTKYGDGGVDLLPLGGLYKSQVREFAESIAIPSEIINKPPSAGLWKGQTDEGEMGITYDELDSILVSLGSGAEPACDPSLVEMVKERMRAQAHKCKTPPVFEPWRSR